MSEHESQSAADPVLAAPPPIRIQPRSEPLPEAGSPHPDDAFPSEVEMSLVDHLEELRSRILRSLLAVVLAAGGCLLLVRPLVRLLEVPAAGIRFL